MRNTKKEAIFILLVIFLLPLISAEIFFEPTNPVYNIGDQFNITMSITSTSDVTDFFTSDLVCDNDEINIFKSPYTVNQNEKKIISISTRLDKFLVPLITTDFETECFIRSEYQNSKVNSPKFIISNKIDTSLIIDGVVFAPGDNVNVLGKAIKRNDEPLNGFAEVTIIEIDLAHIGEVVDGNFNFNFTIPTNSHSGNFQIKARAYEKDNQGKIINDGKTLNFIKISQILKEVEIAFTDAAIMPNTSLSYNVLAYDQAGDEMEGEASILISDPNGEIIEKRIIKLGIEPSEFKTSFNSTPGYWNINATVKFLDSSQQFFVEELEKVSFSLENTTLSITNTGNVPYDKPIEISIGNVREVKQISLELGETRKFKLVAPDGHYGIEVGDGSTKENLGSTFLTGNAISVNDVGNILTDKFSLVISLILILIIAFASFFIYRFIKRRRNKDPSISFVPKTSKSLSKTPSVEKSSVINNGEIQESSVIALNLKNEHTKETQKVIDDALWKAKEIGAKIYSDHNYRIVVLSPKITKLKDNTINAISLAQTLERTINNYNKKSGQKIDYGIGVNYGDLVMENNEGKVKFSSITNTIATAKRLSRSSSSCVLISEKLHRKTAGKVKASKTNDAWKVERVTDRSQYKDYIKNFTNKN